MGFTGEDINNMRNISIYDEIIVNPQIDELKE